MGKYKTLGKNIILVFSGTAGAKLITFLMLPLYTRWLNVEEYGAVDLITVYSTLLLNIVSCSIFEAIFIFPKNKPLNIQKSYFSTGLIFWFISTITCIVISGISFYLCSRFHFEAFFIKNIWLILGMLIFSFIQQLNQQFLRALNKMNIYSYTGLVQTSTMVVMAFLLIPKFKIGGYILSMIIGELFSTLYTFLFGKTYRYIDFKTFSIPYLKEMLRYSIPIIPNGLMWFLVNSLNKPLLEDYIGLTAVGIMAISTKIPNILNMLYNIFQQAWIVSALDESLNDSYSNFYNRMLRLVVIVQVFLGLLLAFFSKFIVNIFTSESFHQAWIYIPLLVVGIIFINIATFVGSNFAITKESKYYFYSTLWAGLSSLVLSFILIPKFAIWGACFAIVISQFLGMMMRIKYSWKFVKIEKIWFYLINIILLMTSSILCVIFEGNIQLLMIGSIMLFSFLIINYKFLRDDIALIKTKLLKVHN